MSITAPLKSETFSTIALDQKAEARLKSLMSRPITLCTRDDLHKVQTTTQAVFDKVCEAIRDELHIKKVDLFGSAATFCLLPFVVPGDLDFAIECLYDSEVKLCSSIKKAMVSALQIFFGDMDESYLWYYGFQKKAKITLPALHGETSPPKFLLYSLGPDKHNCMEFKICIGNFRRYVSSLDSFYINLNQLSVSKFFAGSYAMHMETALELLKMKKLQTPSPFEVQRNGLQRYVSAISDGFSDDLPDGFITFYKQFENTSEIFKSLCEFHFQHHLQKESGFEFTYYFNALASLYLIKEFDSFEKLKTLVQEHLQKLSLQSLHLSYLQKNLKTKDFYELAPYQLILSLVNPINIKLHLGQEIIFLPVAAKKRTWYLVIPYLVFREAIFQFKIIPEEVFQDLDFHKIIALLLDAATKNKNDLVICEEFVRSLEDLCDSPKAFHSYIAFEILSLFPDVVPSEKMLHYLVKALTYAQEVNQDLLLRIKESINKIPWPQLRSVFADNASLFQLLKATFKERPDRAQVIKELLDELDSPEYLDQLYRALETIAEKEELLLIKSKFIFQSVFSNEKAERLGGLDLLQQADNKTIALCFGCLLHHITKERAFGEVSLVFDHLRQLNEFELLSGIMAFYENYLKQEDAAVLCAYFCNALIIYKDVLSTDSAEEIIKKIVSLDVDNLHLNYLRKNLETSSIEALLAPYTLFSVLGQAKYELISTMQFTTLSLNRSSIYIAIPRLNVEDGFTNLQSIPASVLAQSEFLTIFEKLSEIIQARPAPLPSGYINCLELLNQYSNPVFFYLTWKLFGLFPNNVASPKLLQTLPKAVGFAKSKNYEKSFLKGVSPQILLLFGMEAEEFICQHASSKNSLEATLSFLLHLHFNTQPKVDLLEQEDALNLFLKLFSNTIIDGTALLKSFCIYLEESPLILYPQLVIEIYLVIHSRFDLSLSLSFLEKFLKKIIIDKIPDSFKLLLFDLLTTQSISCTLVHIIFSFLKDKVDADELPNLILMVSSHLLNSTNSDDYEVGKLLLLQLVLNGDSLELVSSQPHMIKHLLQIFRRVIFEFELQILSEKLTELINRKLISSPLIEQVIAGVSSHPAITFELRYGFFKKIEKIDLADREEINFIRHELIAEKVDRVFTYILKDYPSAEPSENKRKEILLKKASFFYFDYDFQKNVLLISKIYHHIKPKSTLIKLMLEFRKNLYTKFPISKLPDKKHAHYKESLEFMFEFYTDSTNVEEVQHFIDFVQMTVKAKEIKYLKPLVNMLGNSQFYKSEFAKIREMILKETADYDLPVAQKISLRKIARRCGKETLILIAILGVAAVVFEIVFHFVNPKIPEILRNQMLDQLIGNCGRFPPLKLSKQ